jgi:hypothetical protein
VDLRFLGLTFTIHHVIQILRLVFTEIFFSI